MKILDSRWKYTYKSAEDAFGHGDEYFYINHQNDYQIETEDSPKYKIVYSFYDEMNERLYIVKEKVDEHSPEFLFADLKKVDDVTYEGREFGIGKSPNSNKLTYVVYSAYYRKSGSNI